MRSKTKVRLRHSSRNTVTNVSIGSIRVFLVLHHGIYGAIAYGTKIRFFKFSKKADGTFVGKTYSGELDVPNEEAY